jgi:diaminohydroxyphosphoribosylaminopyrimidine deaminase/5-amino-6-(5-phosphoribosylamino)uracil reductase
MIALPDQESLTDADLAMLDRALHLAEGAIGLSDPNPRVGCVLADRNGQVIGEGWTQQVGGAHAEIGALNAAAAAGAYTLGATAWVSLEPCSHHGRTPPCCDALIAAGLARVVIACIDPNPQVAGLGVARLRDAGIRVDIASGEISRSARELNIGFFSRMLRQRPWLRMKVAASLDGRTALNNGVSQWITGEAARIDGHRWRRRAGAILSGVGTVAEDDPRLDVRLVPSSRQPLRVVVDSRLQTPAGARLLAPPGEVLIVGADFDAGSAQGLRDCGAEVIALPGPGGKVDLAALLAELGRRGVNELHCEAGHKLNASLLREGLVDEMLVYLAPSLIGIGREMAALGPFESLADSIGLEFTAVERIGADLRIVARLPGRDAFLT